MAAPVGGGVRFVRNFRIFTWGRLERLKRGDFRERLLKRHCAWVQAKFNMGRVAETVPGRLLCR